MTFWMRLGDALDEVGRWMILDDVLIVGVCLG